MSIGRGNRVGLAGHPHNHLAADSIKHDDPKPEARPELTAASLEPLAGQRHIWVAQSLDPASTAYLWGNYLDISGPGRPELLQTCVRQAVEEAEALHVLVRGVAGVPHLLPTVREGWPIPIHDLTGVCEPMVAAENWMREQFSRVPLPERQWMFQHAIFVISEDRTL